MTDLELDSAIRAVASEEYAAPARHPAPDDLLEYHLDNLEAAHRDRVQEHLSLCSECAQVILDYAAFPEFGEVAMSEADDPQESERTDRVLPRADMPPPVARRLPVWSYPLAASLLLGMFALGRWSPSPSPPDAVPRAGGYFADLAPTENGQRGEPQTLTIPTWADRLWLLLELGTPDQHPRYEAVLERDGRPLWRSTVQRNANGVFSVEVPRGFLPVGRYRIRIAGESRGAMEPLATYEFQIAHS